MKEEMSNPMTMLAHYAEDRALYNGAVVPPLFQNSLFTFRSWEAIDQAFSDPANHCIYTRGNNPSVVLAEKKIAKLAGGERARLFGSGMAAISAALFHVLEQGDHVVAVKNIYGPTCNLMTYLNGKMGIETTYVSGETMGEFETAITGKTKLIYLESPSSLVFSLQDIQAVAALARERGIRTIIDNTWASPVFQKPLALGVDLEVHSCTKYMAGHSDLVAGVVIGEEQDLLEIGRNESLLFGGKMAPFEAWLLVRSLRTLPIRMKAHQEGAMAVAGFLEGHPNVRCVWYPGLPSFPQYELARKQMSGFSGLMGFGLATDDLQQIRDFVNHLEIFSIGVSWGGHESLVFAPIISTLKELTEEQFKRIGISPGVMRISVGLEDPDDLIRDLDRALNRITGE
jgi:cystathionine beta-lyase/cystathionine gamma-synthase